MNSLKNKTLIIIMAIAAVAVVGWFGKKAYKAATERRLIAEATQFLHQKDLRNASLSLRRALQVDPMSFEAAQMMGDLDEAVGSPAAVGWRIRAAQLRPTQVEYRFAWAKTALKLQDSRAAANALDGVGAKGRDSADFHKLAGALAWELKLPGEAEQQYADALRLEPNDQSIVLSLATIHLGSTNSQIAAAALATMEEISRSSNPELRFPALHFLARNAEAHESFGKAIDFSRQILASPQSNFTDKIYHLTLLREAGDTQFAPWLASLKQEAAQTPLPAFLLGQWMIASENPTDALKWLRSLPAAIQTNQPVPLIITDCEIALKDWTGLLALIHSEDWGELNYYRLVVESLAERSLGHETAGVAAWQKATRLASHRLDCLSRLTKLTEAWNWVPEYVETLNKITVAFPSEKWAVDQLVAQLYAKGDTRGIAQLLARIQASDASDTRLENNLANVLLLLNSEIDKASRMAKEAYDTAPADPFFASTYAYSLLMQKKPDEAVKAFHRVKQENLRIPAVAAYYGLVEAEAGNKAGAKESLARAESAKLLPEEEEMVRRALAQL